MITNPTSGTQIDEIAKSVYRITTPVPPSVIPGGFSFNQYLLASDEPLLFHTGPRKMFPLVRQAIEAVVPVARLAYIGLSHFEADECGALNDFLAVAPQARPVCGRVAAMVSVNDVADRPAHVLGNGDTLALGSHRVRWFDAPHLPHAWECGYLFEESTATLFCGDLFTQPGAEHPPLTRGDILEPSEAFRGKMDYYSHTKNAHALLDRLASTQPRTLACMHGSAWEGDAAGLLRALAARLEA